MSAMWNKSELLPAPPFSSSSGLILQPFWDYIRLQHHSTVSSPFFPLLITLSGYFFFSLPFLTIDLLGKKLPSFHQYKIQQAKQPTLQEMATCLWRVLYQYVVFVIPAMVINSFLMPSPPLRATAPSVLELGSGVLGCLLLFDFQYYVWHVVHHRHRYLYRCVHALHHDVTAPFALVTQYLGTAELLTIGFWSNSNPLLLGCHPLTSWLFTLVSTWMSVEDHSGYDMPWALHHIVPWGLYGGAPAHDVHHQKPHSNFAPFFSHWDKVFGTAISADAASSFPDKEK
ncbi:cholesterol 25-hydroxylase-like protein 1, member 1 [Lepisosteus oculatus]|uniref:cholesterol 25-hydroxylase-like protein 1, member 1 n=1 Tax=Lepisosteus oculatus TaxID=7918 RepID=UPI00371CDE1C